MKFEYDSEVDAGYIYLVPKIEKGEAKKTIQLNKNIILDFNEKGQLIGIEILNAKQILGEHTLISQKIEKYS